MYQVKYGSHFSGGKVTVPPSKSAAIRALLCAALTQGGCLLENIELSDDVLATMKAVEALGAKTAVDPSQKNAWVKAGDFAGGSEVDCGESGSLLRFIIPIAAALGGSWRFTGRGRLPQRPIGVYQDLLPTHGVNVSTQGGLPLEIEGQLKPGRFELPGDISSQFVTGLMFALPLLDGDSEIVLTSPLESCGYVDMTWDILGDFGVKLISTHKGWRVPEIGRAHV